MYSIIYIYISLLFFFVFFICRARSNLSDNIIYSLQRKDSFEKSQNISDSQENINSDFFDDNAQNYNRYKNNLRISKPRENLDVYRENVNQRFDREKAYRPNTKMLDSDSAQCWRTDKNPQNNRTKYQQDRYVQPRKYNERFNQRNSYSGRNGYRDDYEEEPEWFSNGPESMNDFIDLKGFDDDENSASDNLSQELTNKRSSLDFGTQNSGDLLDISKNEKFNHNMSDLSAMLNMDVSKLLNSSNGSILENINDIPFSMFGDLNSSNSSSRAQKWFKSKNESTNCEENFQNVSQSTSSSPLTVPSSAKADILRQLFNPQTQLKSMSSSQTNLADLKIDISKATSVAELEASMLNHSSVKNNENGSSQDSVVLSKILSLAGQKESKSNIPSDLPFNSSSPFNLHSNQSNGLYNSMPMNGPNVLPNSAPIFHDMTQFANSNMHRMVHPSFLKGPSPPFYPENNMPFNLDNGQRAPASFVPPIPPELAHQFFSPNAFMPPGFMPNGPFPPSMMMNPNQMPPHIAAQIFAQYNAMVQSSLMHQDHVKSKSDEPNLTDKLLKNSKFTPTSVFRKLNDQNKTKQVSTKADQHSFVQSKSEMDPFIANKSNLPFEMNRDYAPVNDFGNTRIPNTIPHPLSNYNQPTNGNASFSEYNKPNYLIHLF